MEEAKKNCYDIAQELLDKLKKNEESISKEELNTRYKKSYENLKAEICKALTEVMRSFIFGSLYVKHGDRDSAKKIFDKVDEIFAEEKENGTIQRAKEIAMITYKLEEFVNAICYLNCRIRYEAYGPYWVSQCQSYNGDNDTYKWYNGIIHMWYNVKDKMWVRQDGEQKYSFGIYFPPTQEDLMKEYEEDKEELKKWEKEHWTKLNLPQFVA